MRDMTIEIKEPDEKSAGRYSLWINGEFKSYMTEEEYAQYILALQRLQGLKPS